MTWAELKEGHGEGPLCVTSGGTGLDIRRRRRLKLPLQDSGNWTTSGSRAQAPDGFTERLPIRQSLGRFIVHRAQVYGLPPEVLDRLLCGIVGLL